MKNVILQIGLSGVGGLGFRSVCNMKTQVVREWFQSGSKVAPLHYEEWYSSYSLWCCT